MIIFNNRQQTTQYRLGPGSRIIERRPNSYRARWHSWLMYDTPAQAQEAIQRLMSMQSLEGVLADVVSWGKETFPDANDQGIIAHMLREMRELVDDPSDGEEMADVLILLTHLAAYHGVDLREQVERKMAINRTRTWGKPDAQGVIQHVEPSS